MPITPSFLGSTHCKLGPLLSVFFFSFSFLSCTTFMFSKPWFLLGILADEPFFDFIFPKEKWWREPGLTALRIFDCRNSKPMTGLEWDQRSIATTASSMATGTSLDFVGGQGSRGRRQHDLSLVLLDHPNHLGVEDILEMSWSPSTTVKTLTPYMTHSNKNNKSVSKGGSKSKNQIQFEEQVIKTPSKGSTYLCQWNILFVLVEHTLSSVYSILPIINNLQTQISCIP